MPPLLAYSPSQDTVVDSIGVLKIAVTAHDQSLIDSIALQAQGVPNTFQSVYPKDTTALVFWTVTLATLRHKAFTFQVVAGDGLGHSTTSPTVKVTPR
jgi:hypothetical protein